MPRPRFLFVLFDGLRRDMVRPDLMPNLHRFRETWCDYPNSSSAFPSETRVQVSSFVTGAYPGGNVLTCDQNGGAGHGIMANSFYDPVLGFDRAMDTSDTERMARAQQIYGRLQKAESLGEILARAGRTYAVVTTGTIGNSRLLNCFAAKLGQPVFSTKNAGLSTPAEDHARIIERFGPAPAPTIPDLAVTDYATAVLLQHYIPIHDADVQVIWYNEPDISYHYRGIGSPESAAAARAVDSGFGRILDWWDSDGRGNGWRIIAASDHAQITVARQIKVTDILAAAGFRVGPAIGPDCDLAVKAGYSGQISVRDRDPALLSSLIAFLQEQDWCGLTFTRDGGNGALPMGLINVLNERSPDLNYIMRTNDGANAFGYRGTCVADNTGIPLGGGVHGGLHPVEINNVLTLGGDGLCRQTVRDVPASIVDIAPTILHRLGVATPDTVMGRTLGEAFGDDEPVWQERIVQAEAGHYSQAMTVGAVEGSWSAYLRGGRRLR